MKHEDWEVDRRAMDWLNQPENKRCNDILGLCFWIPNLFLPFIFGQFIVGALVYEFTQYKLGWMAQLLAVLAAIGHFCLVVWLWGLILPRGGT